MAPAGTLDELPGAIRDRLGPRSVVLLGMMGSGKTTTGRRLAQTLSRSFVDADDAIEEAAQRSIAEIFALFGEAYFRDGERRVVARLLKGPSQVIALGGGAWLDARTRAAAAEAGAVSIWLDVDEAMLMERLRRRTHRPLLDGHDMARRVPEMLALRRPLYALADLRVAPSPAGPWDQGFAALLQALHAHLTAAGDGPATTLDGSEPAAP